MSDYYHGSTSVTGGDGDGGPDHDAIYESFKKEASSPSYHSPPAYPPMTAASELPAGTTAHGTGEIIFLVGVIIFLTVLILDVFIFGCFIFRRRRNQMKISVEMSPEDRSPTDRGHVQWGANTVIEADESSVATSKTSTTGLGTVL